MAAKGDATTAAVAALGMLGMWAKGVGATKSRDEWALLLAKAAAIISPHDPAGLLLDAAEAATRLPPPGNDS